MKVRLAAVFLLLSAVGLATADKADEELERLAQVERFAFGGVGYAGVISAGEQDFRAILKRPSALHDLERLFAIGNPQAKSYALVGIKKLDRRRFEQLAASAQDSALEVRTQSGCIVQQQSFSSVLKKIAAGDYDRY